MNPENDPEGEEIDRLHEEYLNDEWERFFDPDDEKLIDINQ